MATIEERINQIVERHAECRWLDACDLRKYLEQIATEQKVIDDNDCMTMVDAAVKEAKQVFLDKACDWLKAYDITFTETPSMLEDFRKAMAE